MPAKVIGDAARIATVVNRSLGPIATAAARIDEMTKLVDLPEAIKAYQLARPIVAPQISAQVAQGVAQTISRLGASFVPPPRQQSAFAKAFDELSAAALIQPRVVDAFREFDMSGALRGQLAPTLRDWPRFSPTYFAPPDVAYSPAPTAAHEGAAASMPAARDALAAWWQTLPPAKRRGIARDLGLYVAALLGLALALAHGGAMEVAVAALTTALAVDQFHWRLTGHSD